MDLLLLTSLFEGSRLFRAARDELGVLSRSIAELDADLPNGRRRSDLVDSESPDFKLLELESPPYPFSLLERERVMTPRRSAEE